MNLQRNYCVLLALMLVVMLGFGCDYNANRSITVTSLRGTYKCNTQPPITQLELTNTFLIEYNQDIFSVRIYDVHSNLLSQSFFDGEDIGHWWHSSFKKAQDTAWIWGKNNSVYEAPPLSTAELMILSPLAIACPEIDKSILNKLKIAFTNYYDNIPLICETNYSGGVHVVESRRPDGQLTTRCYNTHNAVSGVGIFTNSICRITYENFTNLDGVFIPGSVQIEDMRLGVSLDCRYCLDLKNMIHKSILKNDIYPDISASDTYILDKRIGFSRYTIKNGAWPSKLDSHFKKTNLRRKVMLGVLIAFFAIPLYFLYLSQTRKQK